jgi:hypothetical protein
MGARNSGLPMAKSRPYFIEMAGKNKFDLQSKKKIAGEIL